jgi:hypothetical protein
VAAVGEGVSDDFSLGWTTSEFGCFALSLQYQFTYLLVGICKNRSRVVVAGSTALLLAVPIDLMNRSNGIQTQVYFHHPLANENSKSSLDLSAFIGESIRTELNVPEPQL